MAAHHHRAKGARRRLLQGRVPVPPQTSALRSRLRAPYNPNVDGSSPNLQATAPSNHALLQSLLHHVGEADIPPVCCAPSKMDSLTLLYFDKRENIVLKSFPKMLVKACGCM